VTYDQRDCEELRIARWGQAGSRPDQAIEVIADVQLLEEEADEPSRPLQVTRLVDE
jgi:hypothetical protein